MSAFLADCIVLFLFSFCFSFVFLIIAELFLVRFSFVTDNFLELYHFSNDIVERNCKFTCSSRINLKLS